MLLSIRCWSKHDTWFFVTFLALLAKVLHIATLEKFSSNIPKTISAARQFMGYNRDDFEKWVTCRDCSSIYKFEDCIEKLRNGICISKKCSFIMFPNHTHHNRQKPCNAVLLKNVKTSAGTIALQPCTVYCYKSVVSYLTEFFQRPNFFSLCEHWRTRTTSSGVFHDMAKYGMSFCL